MQQLFADSVELDLGPSALQRLLGMGSGVVAKVLTAGRARVNLQALMEAIRAVPSPFHTVLLPPRDTAEGAGGEARQGEGVSEVAPRQRRGSARRDTAPGTPIDPGEAAANAQAVMVAADRAARIAEDLEQHVREAPGLFFHKQDSAADGVQLVLSFSMWRSNTSAALD